MRSIRRLPLAALLAASVASTPIAVAPVAWAVPAAPTLVADYEFNDSLGDSLQAGADLSSIGPGENAFATETFFGQSRRVLSFPKDNGLSLMPVSGVLPSSHYTIDIDFRFTDVSGYRRLVDFKNGTSDCGMYQDNAELYFFCVKVATPTVFVAANTWMRVTLTRDSSGTFRAYLDGDEQLSFSDTNADALSDASDILRFFRDNECVAACGEASAGEVARIRFYDDALDATTIAAAEPCGDGNKSGSITSSDALVALRAAVGSGSCSHAICDVSGDAKVTATDALLILQHAVGLNVMFICGTIAEPGSAASPADAILSGLQGD